MIFAALATTSHMWDDFGMLNQELGQILPSFSWNRINNIEKLLIETLDYRLIVHFDEFEKYFTHIHHIMMRTADRHHSENKNTCSASPASSINHAYAEKEGIYMDTFRVTNWFNQGRCHMWGQVLVSSELV